MDFRAKKYTDMSGYLDVSLGKKEDYLQARLIEPDENQSGAAFGVNLFKILSNNTIITVFSTESRSIWQKDDSVDGV